MSRRTGRLALLLLAAASAALAQTPPVTITTATPLPDGYLGLSYGVPPDFTGLQFTAQTNPSPVSISWSIVVGTGTGLPPGLSIDPNGTGFFSGTPTTTGNYTFDVKAQTQYGSATKTFALHVTTPQATITSTSPLPQAFINQSYSYTFTGTSTPALGILWSAPTNSIPAGMFLNSAGLLYGVPTAPGTYTIPVTAQLTRTQVSTTQSFSLTVNAGQVSILTTSLPVAAVGQGYAAKLTASPAGVTWLLAGSSLPPGLGIDINTGVISGTATQAGTYGFTVQASYPGYTSASATFNLYVSNGTLKILETSLPIAIQNAPYNVTLTPQGGLAPFGWAITGSNPLGLSIDSKNGIISGTPTLPAGTSYPLQVTLSDVTGTQFTQPYSLFVASALTVATTTLPNGFVGVLYSQQLSAGGGQPPYSWVIQSAVGSLPSGLSLNSNGLISGTPTVNGSFTFGVQVTDNGRRTATATLSITIGLPVTLTIAPPSLPDGRPNVAYSVQLTTSGGQAPYTFTTTGGALPTGLTLSAGGLLSGTPLGPVATSTFTVSVHDSTTGASPPSGQKTYTLNIVLPLSITTTSLPNGTIGAPYPTSGPPFAIQASGGEPPYSFTIVSGTQPAGLKLDLTGILSGTPTGPAGVSTITVMVQDAGGQTAQKQFTITIAAPANPPVISTGNLSGTVGAPFSATLAATGGTAPYTFGLVSGVPPAGLIFTPSTGTLSGTPTIPGSTSLTFSVTDAQQQLATKTITITIAAAGNPPVISTGNLSGIVGGAFTATLAATGGTAPYSFALTSGTPPAGLTFTASTATLSGTPTAAGSTNLTFTVTDAQQQSASKVITITISSAAPIPATIGTIPPNPAQQPNVVVTLGTASSVPVTATLSVAFTSAAGGSPSEVQFITSAGGSQTATVTIPAGQTTAPAVPLATGTVAGTITVTTKLTAGGADVTPSPAPTQTIVIAKSAPVIQSVAFSNSGGALTVTVIGYSTTREVVSGDFVFSASTGNTVSNSGDVPVQLTPAFTTWFASSPSNPFGGQFKLTIPFTVANGTSTSITSVSVTLTNTIGTSARVSPQ